MNPRSRCTGVLGALAALLALASAACGSSDAAAPDPTPSTVGGVGELPDDLSSTTQVGRGDGPFVEETSSTSSTSSSVVGDAAGIEADPIGERVEGNRVIMIGDSLLASTSRRYGNTMCPAMTELGWAVEVDAETGRFIDFGDRVLDARLRPEQGTDWDAAVVFLGNNYGSDLEVFERFMDDIVERLAPRPTVVVTVTEIRSDRAPLNDYLRGLADEYEHVEVLDWAVASSEQPAVLSGDGLHLSDGGREVLASEVSARFGAAPDDAEGDCLSTAFTNDSAGRPGGPSSGSSGRGSSGGGSSGSGGGGSAGSGGSSGSATTAPATSAATTAPPDTTAPTDTTAPPATTAPSATPAPTDPPPAATDPPPPDPPPEPPAPTDPPATDPPPGP